MGIEDTERLLHRGRYREVLESSVQESEAASRSALPGLAVRWRMLAVQACRYIGRTAECASHADQAIETARASGDPALVAQARYGRAVALKSSRDFDGAIQELRAATETMPAGASELDRATLLLETAETTLEAGLRPEAEAALAKGSALVHWLKEPRLLAWSLYLRSHFEGPTPADLQLSAAYEIARTSECPELQWQILWRLSERATQQGRDKMQEDCLWNALDILTRLAEPLDPSDATTFWRQGTRRGFLDAVKRKFGAQFLQRVMQDGPPTADHATRIIRDLGFDAATIPEFGRKESPPQSP